MSQNVITYVFGGRIAFREIKIPLDNKKTYTYVNIKGSDSEYKNNPFLYVFQGKKSIFWQVNQR